jgi:zinc D-Ala-D-Ala dipeptidase
MNLEEKLARSRSTERIDFSKYQPINQDDPLVRIEANDRILVEPCWTVEGDWEGQRYRDYIAGHPEYDGTYARSELVKRLQAAAAALDSDYRLVVRAAHRPIEVQVRILLDCASDYKRDHPEVTDEVALEHARDFVNDPDLTLPPHVCGAAVDVDVMEVKSDKLLDFGNKMNDDSEKSSIYYPDLTDEQKKNRLMLVATMLDAGLASCKPEWWHFSYGDQVWAWFYGENNSLYSPINL